jgi:RNA polymerase sigma-70 factor, ECF subfamily
VYLLSEFFFDIPSSKGIFMKVELLEKLVGGDESAYKYLFESYYRPLTAFAFRFFQEVQMAKDVVQNVFLKIYQNRQSLRTVTDIRSYLYKAVYNECLNEIRKHDTRDRYHAQYAVFQQTSFFEQTLEQTEKERRILDAIESLPPKCREIFLMSRLEGRKNREIAETLKISIRTVETQISIGLKTLRKLLLSVILFFL